MDFRRVHDTAAFLDPREGFAAARVPFEVRWDPLTGQSCRLLPAGSVPAPQRHDLERLSAETRPACPFCPDAIERQTPRFPPEIVADGRISAGEAVLFPNLVAYARWSAVSVYSPERHLLSIERLTPPLLAGNLRTQVEFARAVLAHDREASWIAISANHLPPSGSSIFHPHLQGTADPRPTTAQRLFAELPDAAVRAYLDAERRSGERHIASGARVEWLASFAPIGPAEVRAVVHGAALPDQLDDDAVDELARGLAAVLRVYAALGFQSFNLALYGMAGAYLLLRMVARAYFGAQGRSDAMWSERLHWEGATDVAPERTAELVRDEL